MKKKISKKDKIPKNHYEEKLKGEGYKFICGLDEVGRGAWAGPLVAGAVILDRRYYGLRDSKLLSGSKREKLAQKIKRSCYWGIGEVSVEEIDKLKLTKATQLVFRRAVENLKVNPDFLLIDGTNPLLYSERAGASRTGCLAIIKGDMRCVSITAASIVAKVYRDKLMCQLSKKNKGYSFHLHKGYGTKLHQERLAKLGPSEHHRKTFATIKKILKKP